jgi:hypothetical protein
MRVSQLGKLAAVLCFGMMVSSASAASAVQAFTPQQSEVMKNCLESNKIKTGANMSGFTEAQKAAVNKCQTIALGKTSVTAAPATKATAPAVAVKPKKAAKKVEDSEEDESN